MSRRLLLINGLLNVDFGAERLAADKTDLSRLTRRDNGDTLKWNILRGIWGPPDVSPEVKATRKPLNDRAAAGMKGQRQVEREEDPSAMTARIPPLY